VFFGDPSGVNDVRGEESNMTLYPNPTSGMLTVQLNDASIIDAYTLRDITGSAIRHDDFKIPVHVANVNMEMAAGGVYLLQVRSGDRLFSKKVIKQ
jgi:hypothetical protein